MFSERLRLLRKKHNLTMRELGEQLNIASTTISGYENDRRKPDLSTLHEIADYFHTSTDYLIGRTNDPSPPPQTKKEPYALYFDSITMEEMDYLKETLATFRKYREQRK